MHTSIFIIMGLFITHILAISDIVEIKPLPIIKKDEPPGNDSVWNMEMEKWKEYNGTFFNASKRPSKDSAMETRNADQNFDELVNETGSLFETEISPGNT